MQASEIFEAEPISSEFKRWFDGSKIVDAAGNPLRLYHGTSRDQDFKQFKVPGNGAWFTTNPKDASQYAIENDSQNYRWDSGGYVRTNTASRVIPVYVRAMNPLRITELPDEVRHAGANNRGGDPTKTYRKAQRDWFDKLRREGYDAVVIGGDTVVVLNSPKQIKSAIGNRMT